VAQFRATRPPSFAATLSSSILDVTYIDGLGTEHASVPDRALTAVTPSKDFPHVSTGSAVLSCLREVIPSFPNTLRRCHSTVRALRNN
jgi:hypothetical protein